MDERKAKVGKLALQALMFSRRGACLNPLRLLYQREDDEPLATQPHLTAQKAVRLHPLLRRNHGRLDREASGRQFIDDG